MKQTNKPKGLIMCDKTGKWREELERRLQTQEKVTLTALGEVRYDVLKHLNKRTDVEIIKLETGYRKTREKGLGLKVTVRRVSPRLENKGRNNCTPT